MMRVPRTIYGHAIPDPDRVIVARWASEPFTSGSYSHIPVGATGEEYDMLAEPLAEGHLRFAGEATMRHYPGTVHGTFLSGLQRSRARRRSDLSERRSH